MDRKRALIALAVLAAAISGAAFFGRPGLAQEKTENAVIAARLDEILNGQKAIAQEIAAIREELNIVKVRVTQIQ